MATPSTVRPQNPVLTNIAIQFAQEPDVYVADEFMPMRDTQGQVTGTYFIYDAPNLFNTYDALRAPSSIAKHIDVNYTSAQFSVKPYALAYKFDDFLSDSAMPPINLRDDGIAALVISHRNSREKRVRDLIWGSVTSTVYSGADETSWDGNMTGTDPFKQFNIERRKIQLAVGRKPNLAVFAQNVMETLQNGTGGQAGGILVDRVKAAAVILTSDINEEFLQRAFAIARVRVAEATVDNTAWTPAAATSLANGEFLWNNKNVSGTETPVGAIFLVATQPGGPTVKSMTYGATFAQMQYDTVQYRVEREESWELEVRCRFDEKIIVAKALSALEVLQNPF